MPKLAFDSLLDFSFRGIGMPVSSRERSLNHEVVQSSIQFGSGQLLTTPSIGNPRYTYRIVASDGLTGFGYKDLFTVELRRMVLAMADRSPGPLIDPVEGEIRAKPISDAETLDAQRMRDGADLLLVFEKAPTLEEVEGEIVDDDSLDWAIDQAVQLDAEIAQLEWEQGAPEQITSTPVVWVQTPPPLPSPNPLDQISGLLRNIDHALNKPAALLQDAAFRLNKLNSEIDRLGSPKRTSQTQAAVQHLHLSVMRLLTRRRSEQRPTRTVKLPRRMTTSFAAQYAGLTFEDFLKLNPGYGTKLTLPQNAIVIAYK